MPWDIFAALSPIGQQICAGLEAPPGVEVKRPVFGKGVEGWGWMHTEDGFKKRSPTPELARL
jgi:hypothetical protein